MRLLLLLILSLLGLSCQRQTYSLQQLPPTYLVYGQGGGYAGQETANYLFPTGQRLQFKTLSRDTVNLPRLKRREARKYLAQADSLFQTAETVQAPGNLYQFVRYQTSDTLYQATWGAVDYTPSAALLRLYRGLTTAPAGK